MRIVIEATYRGRLTAWHVRRILKWIDPKDLEGLEAVRLMNSEPDDPDANTHPPYLTGFLYNGRYLRKKKNRPAMIALFTKDLYFPIPSILSTSSLATLRIQFCNSS